MKRMLLFSFLITAQLILAQDLDAGLLLHYPLDGNCNDLTANAYNGDPYGLVFGEDRFGNPNSAAFFDGIDDYLNFPNLEELKPQLPVTFSFWIRYEDDSWQHQVVFNTSMEENHSTSVTFNASSDGHYVINYSDGQYFYGSGSRRSFRTNEAVVSGTWHHFSIIVHSATNMQIYRNCQKLIGTYSGEGGDLQYSMNPGCIGRHDRSLTEPLDYFKGYIDDFRYYDRELSSLEMGLLCNSLSSPDQEMARNSFYVYPNPATDKFYVVSNSNDFKMVTVSDITGKTIYSGGFSQGIDTSLWAKGMYFVSLPGNNKIPAQKLIVN